MIRAIAFTWFGGIVASTESKIVRVLRLLDLIRRRKHGVTLAEMAADLGASKPSAKRYVGVLVEAGVPIEAKRLGGEVRWLISRADERYRPSAAELFALASSRELLRGLEGTKAVAWLDRRLKERRPRISVDRPAHHDAALAAAVERALVEEKRLRIDYRGVKDAKPKRRDVEPLELRFSARAWYLFARDVEKNELRTFKLARVAGAKVLPDSITSSQIDAAPDENQVGVWQSTDRHHVVIRIFPPSARFVHEYPLTVSQTISEEIDGSAVVRATVNGLEEVTRWVLRWGSAARVEAPATLADTIAAELNATIRHYGTRATHGGDQPYETRRATGGA